MSKILFVTYGAGHVEIVLSLLPRLQELGVATTVLALTTAAPRLRREGCDFRTCCDYLPAPGYELACEIGEQLSKELWLDDSGITKDESCAYLGVSMVDLIADHGAEIAWRLYSDHGRRAFCPTRFLRHVLQHEQPSLVLTTCRVRMELAALLAARQIGCRSVLIEDLFGFSLLGEKSIHAFSQLPPSVEWPDEVIVLNQQVKDRLVKAGFPATAVHAMGQPVFSDWLARYDATEPCSSVNQWRRQGRPVIAYAAPARRDVLQRHLALMVTLAMQNPGWDIVVKLHPSVSTASVQVELDHGLDNLLVLPGDLDSLPVVKASDLLIVFRSTLGLLALFAGLPLLVFEDSGEPEVMPYVSSGAASGASTLAQLQQAIAHELSRMPTPGLQLRHPLFENPPRASERIAAFLQSLVQA
ncbi:MAG: hypothetical protein FJ060_00670 [Cyanobacteria bacterium K_Offshore_0m_m2_072]|nr:hypothetical protein [Cyanobacteria bacterium K_Offshore_0m_m2_072]